ncbi:hypothetical protein GGX14DRAFT_522233 [Mycena pura]|uniref:RBR-type E3 ubiquitin transferase n=1 Tax=Mycena pura TaxID=153505 RepID=A0AAD6Y9M8_9AGAR|nr:hypothetical protein GGX14DRAFT_522233 [Mycena pura]
MSPPRPPCLFFQRNACSYGDSCRNSHVVAKSSSVASPPPLPDPSSPTCAYFLRGLCRYGDQCREFHPPSKSSLSGSVNIWPTKKPPCRYFIRGSCAKGTNCPFSHEAGDILPVAEAESFPKTRDLIPTREEKTLPLPSRGCKDHEACPSADRVIYNCNVQFGAGAAVLHVVTPFESRRVLVSNIPSSATDAAISTALSHFSVAAEIQIHRSSATTATLAFHDASAAAQAASIAGEISMGGRKLSAQLDVRAYTAAEEGQGVVRGRKVKVTWYGRRASAFVHYLTAQSAEEHAHQLNGKSYRGYTISASFRRPTPAPARGRGRFIRTSSQLYTVMIRNLPLDISTIDLQRFCQAESVAVDPPRCPVNSPSQMREALEAFGPIETFDTLPMTKATAKISAFAQFQNANSAAAAETALRATPPSFLGGTPFFIERTFSVKYSVRPNLFTKIQGTLDLLAGHHPSMLRYYLGEALNDPTIVVLHGSEPKLLGRVKTELDKIIQGELLVVEGQKFWDDFFEGTEGQTFLDSLNTSENVLIRCDARTRTVRLFGPETERIQARNRALEKIAEVRARRHAFPLRKDLIRLLLRGKMRQLQDEMGVEHLVLDVVARTLTVNGDDNHIRRVRAELVALESGKILGAAADSESTCPVCFCDLEDPVTLDCGHPYCRDCLQHYLRPTPQDPSFSPRKCVAEIISSDPETSVPCGLHISYNIIRSLLTSAQEDSLLHASFLTYINEHPLDFKYCPSPDCEMVYRPTTMGSALQCPSCLIHICPACNVEYHDGMSCAEHQDNLTGGLAALAQWREKHGVKQCPNCHADIEKNGGCNHMTCFLCKTHICWICMKTFSDQGNDGGIYPHMQREHGGMYASI